MNRRFILLLLAAVLGLVLLILWNFLTPIILSVLLALLAAPFNSGLRARLRGRRNVAALLVVVGTFLVIVVPVTAFLLLLVTQGADLMREAAAQLEAGAVGAIAELPLLGELQSIVEGTIPQAQLDGATLREQLAGVADSAVRYLVNSGLTVFGNVADVVAKFFILLFLLFYLVRDGESMVERLRSLLPLRREQTEQIFAKIRDVTRAVVFGTLAIAALQGLLGGIGFWVVGLPPLVWGTVIGVSSFIPVVGTGLVTIPAIAYLAFNELWWQAGFFSVWAFVLVGGVDNYLRPFVMQGEARMSPFYIFLAIIGGLATFGLSGLIFGPLVIALAIVVVDIYRDEYVGARSRRVRARDIGAGATNGSRWPRREDAHRARRSRAPWHVRRLIRRSGR